ncbi:hypothetical protein Q8F55_002751 [Vanrija albida]|uniref:BTB domain-containing protein n=1 Tax=Vanrija albida TaxID=181172 RepID=A0ABR3QAP7_9TREE
MPVRITRVTSYDDLHAAPLIEHEVKMKARACDNDDEITNDKHWTTGDFAIVSSDNVRFFVDRHYLLSASSVFRDMLSVARPDHPEIQLTDRFLETALVIGHFLRLITKAELGFSPSEMVKIVHLAQFLLKFDCTAAIKVLILLARDQISARKRSKIYLFVLGAAIDDPDLCFHAMASDTLSTWNGDNEFDTSDARFCRAKGNAFNPQALSFTVWSILPAEYLWALNRAWGMVGNTKELPTKFRELLAAAKVAKLLLKDAERPNIYRFCFGAAIDDVDYCVGCMSGGLGLVWTGEDDKNTSNAATSSRHKAAAFNPQSWPMTWWSRIPGPYLWALNRAWGMAGASKELPDRFKELVTVAKGKYIQAPGDGTDQSALKT